MPKLFTSSRRLPYQMALAIVSPPHRPLEESECAERIVNYYRTVPGTGKPEIPAPVNIDLNTISNTPTGIGDIFILTALTKAAAMVSRMISVYSPGRFFRPLISLDPYYHDLGSGTVWVMVDALNQNYDLGPGHFTQRLQRACGLPVSWRPGGNADKLLGIPKIKNRVIVHLEAGNHSISQRQTIHPRAREVYEENLMVLAQFVKDRKDLEFVEIGATILHSYMRGYVENYCYFEATPSIVDTAKEMAKAEYFIGVISGPTHLAAALGLKIINIINFPDADQIFLPTLKNIDQVEAEWFYPQAVYLHQDNAGPLVPRFSRETLEMSMAGQVYPFWSDRFLGLKL